MESGLNIYLRILYSSPVSTFKPNLQEKRVWYNLWTVDAWTCGLALETFYGWNILFFANIASAAVIKQDRHATAIWISAL